MALWCERASRMSLFNTRFITTSTSSTPSPRINKSTNVHHQKLKILCVHGYGQNGISFRQKSGSIRRAAKTCVSEWDFIEAKLKAPAREDETNDGADGLAWWLWNRSHNNPINTGYEDSINHLIQHLEKNGPFDGVMGFSQGASILALLLAEQEERGANWFQFGVFIGGFLPRMPIMRTKIITNCVDTSIPTWHSFGLSDEIIPAEMSQELIKCFGKNVTVCPAHPGGHLVSSTKEVRLSFKSFLEERKRNK